MRPAATSKGTPAFSFLVNTLVLCGVLLLCGCTSKPTRSAKGESVTGSSNLDNGLTTGVSGSGIAAGAAAAAKFAKHHREHSANRQGWEQIERFGLSLRYPDDWQLNPAVPKDGPIALNTFQSHYSERGGHFPNHGAEIDISYLPKPGGSVQQNITADLQGSKDVKVDELPFLVGDAKAMRASYTDTFRGYLAHQTVAVYVEHGAGLYKFFLTYHKGEAWEPQFIEDFDRILKFARFSQ
jgi:hypothetical protein